MRSRPTPCEIRKHPWQLHEVTQPVTHLVVEAYMVLSIHDTQCSCILEAALQRKLNRITQSPGMPQITQAAKSVSAQRVRYLREETQAQAMQLKYLLCNFPANLLLFALCPRLCHSPAVCLALSCVLSLLCRFAIILTLRASLVSC